MILIRKDYFKERQEKIINTILLILNNIVEMTTTYEQYLAKPTKEKQDNILNNEIDVNKNRETIEKNVMEIISLEQLDPESIKWLLSINKITTDLERIGDNLTNIVTISNLIDTKEIRPNLLQFIGYEKDMMYWLIEGIKTANFEKLNRVVTHDHYVNKLNKQTYKNLVELINEKESLQESNVTLIIISRFLERIGDHLVNTAKMYKGLLAKPNLYEE